VGTPEAIIEVQRYAQVGSQYVTFQMPDAREIEPILLLGETVCPPWPNLRRRRSRDLELGQPADETVRRAPQHRSTF